MSKRFVIQSGDKILVSRTDRLGDLILALPFVEALKTHYPQCPVTVLASEYASPILEHNPWINGIISVNSQAFSDSKEYREELLNRLRDSGFRVVVALYPESRISRLFWEAGIPIRIGTGRRFHSFYFNYRLYHGRKRNERHEYEYNLDFLKFFGQTPDSAAIPRVHLLEEEVSQAQAWLKSRGVEGNFIVLHPGSGGSSERWPLRKFLELYRMLEQKGYTVAVTGSSAEGEIIGAEADSMGLEIKRLEGQTDLRTLAAVLFLSAVAVANSTGPLHLAGAVGTRVVGLYSARGERLPRRWGPVGTDSVIVQPTVKGGSMEGITVDEVADKVVAQYERATASRSVRA